LFQCKGPLPPRESKPESPAEAVESQLETTHPNPALPPHIRSRLEGTLLQCKGPLPPRGSKPESANGNWIPSLTLQYGGSIEPIVFPSGYLTRHGMQEYKRGDYKHEFRVPEHPFRMKEGEKPCCKPTEFEMPPKTLQEPSPPTDEKGKAPEKPSEKSDVPPAASAPLPLVTEPPELPTPAVQEVPRPGIQGPSNHIGQQLALVTKEVPKRGVCPFSPSELVAQGLHCQQGKCLQDFYAKSPAVDEDDPSIPMTGSYFRRTAPDIQAFSSLTAQLRPPAQQRLQDFYKGPPTSAQVSPTSSTSDTTIRPLRQQASTKWKYGQPIKHGVYTYYINPITGLYPEGVPMPNTSPSYRAPPRHPSSARKSDYSGNKTQAHASGSPAPQQRGGRRKHYRQPPQPVVYFEIPKPQPPQGEHMCFQDEGKRNIDAPQSDY
jgi:hypothetical protein